MRKCSDSSAEQKTSKGILIITVLLFVFRNQYLFGCIQYHWWFCFPFILPICILDIKAESQFLKITEGNTRANENNETPPLLVFLLIYHYSLSIWKLGSIIRKSAHVTTIPFDFEGRCIRSISSGKE